MSKTNNPRTDGAICLFLTSFRGGGAERFMVVLAGTLVNRGYEVDLVVSQADGPYRDQVDSRVNIIDLGHQKVFASVFSLVRYFNESRPIAILSTMMHANAVCGIALGLSRHKAPLVLREAIEPMPGGTLHNRIIYAVAKHVYRRADAIIGVSEATATKTSDALKFPPQLPLHVIDNPFLPEMLELSKLDTEQAIPGDSSAAFILAAGRLELAKDFRTLISAVARLKKNRDVKLIILGEGGERNALEQQIKNEGLEGSVFLPGFVKNPFAWMSRCDVFVLSSVLEGSPNILIQSVACGAKVVASRLPGCTNSLLAKDDVGRLVDTGDVEGFAAAIAQTLDSPEKPDASAWRQRFDIETIADAYLAVMLQTDEASKTLLEAP